MFSLGKKKNTLKMLKINKRENIKTKKMELIVVKSICHQSAWHKEIKLKINIK